MTRRLALLALLTVSLTCRAQDADPHGLTAARCMTVAPERIFPMIEGNVRLDMLDYYHAGVDRHSLNIVDGECYITAETPHTLAFVGGTDLQYQIFVLNPESASPVIGVIETIDTPIPDSRVRFYDSRWNPVPATFLQPTLKDWMKKADAKKIDQVRQAIPFMMYTWSYDDASRRLTATNNMAAYFTAADTPAAMQYLRDSLSYSWDGKKFKLDK